MLTSQIRVHVFMEKNWFHLFLEPNANALDNKTMYIIACCLQIHSLKLKWVQTTAQNLELAFFILDTVVYRTATRYNKAYGSLSGICYTSNQNSVCVYRTLNFIGYSESIFANEFTFFFLPKYLHNRACCVLCIACRDKR